MDWLLNGIIDSLREQLIEAILSRFVDIFDGINTQVGDIAAQAGQTPEGWNV